MKDARRNSNREGYSSVNQKDNEDANKLPRDNGVFFEGRSSINHNRGNSLLRSLFHPFVRWQAEAEPRSSWLFLFLSVIPVSILIGFEIISFSIYYVEYVEYFEVPRSAPGFIITVRTIFNGIFGIATSTFINRFPAKAVCMIGGLLVFLAHVGSSFSPNLYVLYLTEGVMIGVALSLTTMTTGVLIQYHFSRNRTLGNGLHMLGLSLGYFTAPPLLTLLIKTYGWRGSYLVYGALAANIIVFGAFYEKPPSSSTRRTALAAAERDDERQPADGVGSEMKDADTTATAASGPSETRSGGGAVKSFCLDVLDLAVVKRRGFLVVCVAAMLGKYTSVTFLQHLPNKAVTLGLTKEEAAMLMSIFGVTGICFRALVTVLANLRHVNRLAFYGCGLFVGAVCSYLTFIHTFWGLAIAASFQGLFLAMTNTICAVVVVEEIGVSKLPKGLAVLHLFVAVSNMSAIPLGGHIYDVTQNYDIPYGMAGSCSVVGGLLIVALVLSKRIRRRRERVEEKQRDDETV